MMKLNRSNPKKLEAMWDIIIDHQDIDFIGYYLHNDGPLAETLSDMPTLLGQYLTTSR